MTKDISAPLHAAHILLALPLVEYRPALATIASIMRRCAADRDVPADQVMAAKAALVALERLLT